nr:serine protease gd isoform X1 [Helicoverpa armigera]
MDVNSVCLCVLVLSLEFVCGQYSSSPCPGIFDYESDGYQVYGKIVLRPVEPVANLVVRINFTVAAQLFSNYVGRLEALDSTHLLQKYNQGQAVSYMVHFPVTSPLPKLTALTVNGDVVCYGPGDIPRPNQYVTTLSLQHTSFLQGNGPVYNNFQHQPQHRPPRPPDHVIDDDDVTAHIYTFNNIDPTWTTGNSPYYVVNNSSPFSQSTQQYQPPTQQVFQSNRPVYDQYEQSVPFQVTTRRPVTYRPNTPVFEQMTKRPTYEPPATRPTDFNNNNFYSPDRVSPTARPTATSPDQRFSNGQTRIDGCGEVAGGNERVPLIYNGQSYPRGDIPWLVAIYKSEAATLRFICGGTLVSDRHVLTAAHCMQRRGESTHMKDIVVKVGVHNLNDWSDDITVTRTLMTAAIHDAFNPATLQNDILIATMNKRVTFNTYIRPACLWGDDTDQSRVVGATGIVAGWGDQGVGGVGKQGEPHMVRIPIVSTKDCRASKPDFHKITYDTTLCAGDRNGSGPCIGDSGGGLYLLDGGKWRLRGIVSVSLRAANGDNTCNLNEYIVFTDTAQYLSWIKKILAEKHFD